MSAHILILDDDPEIRNVLNEHLRGKGFVCTCVEGPEEALSALSKTAFDVLLADIILEGTDGIEVAANAKEMQPELVVIAMTGGATVETAIRAIRIGADDYIEKPFPLAVVTDAVSRGIEKRNVIRRIFEEEKNLKERVTVASEELQESNRQLADTQRYLNNLIESTVDAFITVSTDNVITYANRGAQRMLGYRREEFSGFRFSSLLANGEEELRYLRRVVELDRPLQNFETELRHHDGSLVPVSISFSLAQDSHDNVVSLVAVCKDITEQKRLEHELKEMTIRDSLTGLFNVRYFYDRLEMEIDRAKRQSHELSLLLIDVDKFKQYNDSRGHLEGDNVLAEVGNVILECTRENVDMGFRYGGDEFTVILPEAGEEQALRVANRVISTFKSREFDLLTLSVGMMTYDKRSSAKDFMKYTDSMMYEAKRAGGNQVYAYDSDHAQAAAESSG